ncbi:hypothetical protein Tco_0903182, partial [Tanacetum coccineum]
MWIDHGLSASGAILHDKGSELLTMDDFLKLRAKGIRSLMVKIPPRSNHAPFGRWEREVLIHQANRKRLSERVLLKEVLIPEGHANEAFDSEFGETVSITSIHQSNRKRLSETITSCPKGTAGIAAIGSRPDNVGKEVVDLSENTRVPTTPPINKTQEEQIKHAHSSHSVHNEYNDEDIARRYVLEWGLHEDLLICSHRACKELISHMATLAKDEVLSNLSNGE